MAQHLIQGEAEILNLKPGAKRLNDGSGLYLLPFARGHKHYWRFDYSVGTRRNTLSLGVFPGVSLQDAREHAERLRNNVMNGVDPAPQRKAERRKRCMVRKVWGSQEGIGTVDESFECVARRWFATRSEEWVEGYASKVLGRLEGHVFPYIGSTAMGAIDPASILSVCRRVEQLGAIETAHRVREICSGVFRFSIAEGVLLSDPARDIKAALRKPISRNFPAVTDPERLRPLLRAIHDYTGTQVVRTALQLTPILLVRPGELRLATWDEFDLENGVWMIPSERMKRLKAEKTQGKPHFVPLPKQARVLLANLYPLTKDKGYVFAAEGRKGRPMSANTLNAALRALGYSTKEDVCAHGFRATARTLLVELLEHPESVVEMQLGHAVKDPNGTAYNRTQFIDQRINMMRAWAEFLESLRLGKRVKAQPGHIRFTPITRKNAR